MRINSSIRLKHRAPCARCPFSRRSQPASVFWSEKSFANIAIHSVDDQLPLACVKNDPGEIPLSWCAGQLIFFKRAGLLIDVQNPVIGIACQQVTEDWSVFSSLSELVDHHNNV